MTEIEKFLHKIVKSVCLSTSSKTLTFRRIVVITNNTTNSVKLTEYVIFLTQNIFLLLVYQKKSSKSESHSVGVAMECLFNI